MRAWSSTGCGPSSRCWTAEGFSAAAEQVHRSQSRERTSRRWSELGVTPDRPQPPPGPRHARGRSSPSAPATSSPRSGRPGRRSAPPTTCTRAMSRCSPRRAWAHPSSPARSPGHDGDPRHAVRGARGRPPRHRPALPRRRRGARRAAGAVRSHRPGLRERLPVEGARARRRPRWAPLRPARRAGADRRAGARALVLIGASGGRPGGCGPARPPRCTATATATADCPQTVVELVRAGLGRGPHPRVRCPGHRAVGFLALIPAGRRGRRMSTLAGLTRVGTSGRAAARAGPGRFARSVCSPPPPRCGAGRRARRCAAAPGVGSQLPRTAAVRVRRTVAFVDRRTPWTRSSVGGESSVSSEPTSRRRAGTTADRRGAGTGRDREDGAARSLPGRRSELSVLRASGEEAETLLNYGCPGPAGPLGRDGGRRAAAVTAAPSPVDPILAGTRLLELLGELESAGPVVLVVDDLHWADHPSLRAPSSSRCAGWWPTTCWSCSMRDDAVAELPESLRRVVSGPTATSCGSPGSTSRTFVSWRRSSGSRH